MTCINVPNSLMPGKHMQHATVACVCALYINLPNSLMYGKHQHATIDCVYAFSINLPNRLMYGKPVLHATIDCGLCVSQTKMTKIKRLGDCQMKKIVFGHCDYKPGKWNHRGGQPPAGFQQQ